MATLNDYLNILNYKPQIEREIEKRNRADTYNMVTPQEQENYRHILTSMLYSKRYNPFVAKVMGDINEEKDLVLGKGLNDSRNDLVNNQLGRELYKENPNVSEDEAYDFVFNRYIQPFRR